MAETYPDNVTFYNFTAIYPVDGHCERQQFGDQGPLREPRAAVLGLLMAFQGIYGLCKFQNVATGTRYIFSLLLGYGLSSVGHTCTLWNGWEKTGSCILNLLQAIIITRLINTLKFPPFSTVPHYQLFSSILMSTFGLYPVLAQVVGSSYTSPWISWLTFDLIWVGVVVSVAIIFKYRKSYPQYQQDPEIFYLIFNATVTCIVAYIFWLVDNYACSKAVAWLNFYGFWLFLMGLTFYYLAALDAFLQSAWQSYDAIITRWPRKNIILYIDIQWKPKPNCGNSADPDESASSIPEQD